MYTMPILDTVAGEAFSMLCTSNSSLQVGAMGMRSPLARVSVLLSSNTEFKFSIQMASTGPSRMRKMFSPANKDRTVSSAGGGGITPFLHRANDKNRKLSKCNAMWSLIGLQGKRKHAGGEARAYPF